MSLLQEIQVSRVYYRKEQSTVEFNILTLLVGELETSSKRDGSVITDEKVVTAIKKLIKSNNETMKLTGTSEKLELENKTLAQFLPEEMSKEEIEAALSKVGFSTIGEAMKFMVTNYKGKFDKALVSKIAGDLLK